MVFRSQPVCRLDCRLDCRLVFRPDFRPDLEAWEDLVVEEGSARGCSKGGEGVQREEQFVRKEGEGAKAGTCERARGVVQGSREVIKEQCNQAMYNEREQQPSRRTKEESAAKRASSNVPESVTVVGIRGWRRLGDRAKVVLLLEYRSSILPALSAF